LRTKNAQNPPAAIAAAIAHKTAPTTDGMHHCICMSGATLDTNTAVQRPHRGLETVPAPAPATARSNLATQVKSSTSARGVRSEHEGDGARVVAPGGVADGGRRRQRTRRSRPWSAPSFAAGRRSAKGGERLRV
jgi:hypothetical protein